VKPDGTLIDRMKLDTYPWPEIFASASRAKVSIIPAILWTDKVNIHAVLSNKTKRAAHIQKIVTEVRARNFAGIDIDYENKNVATKRFFSAFLTELKAALKKDNKLLVCTIESRTPSKNQTEVMRSNDYAVINRACDRIRLMTYDQGTIDLELNKKYRQEIYAPNADREWVDKVIKATVSELGRQKLYLGVATYGWEYAVTGQSGSYKYQKLRSITYADALALAASSSVPIKRHAGGEQYFTYQKGSEQRVVWFSDAVAIGQKVAIAAKYRLAGVAIFKIDSSEDPALWQLK
jgi:spore germination protein YaaH